MLRLSIGHLLAALLLGAVLAIPGLPTSVAVLGPAQLHLFVVGWLTQLIMAVAHWMFPRHSVEKPRGRQGLIWATLALLNSGLLLRVIAEPMQVLHPQGGWGWALVVSAAFQWLAAVAFVFNTWPRVRER
jgi:hypothetical protein